ncbi:MAG: hypothetical protein M3R59_11385, partial [Verrucomicrobiota bacterium]|nr:hypothetical protein [Verrucomicrobiota bacterium]
AKALRSPRARRDPARAQEYRKHFLRLCLHELLNDAIAALRENEYTAAQRDVMAVLRLRPSLAGNESMRWLARYAWRFNRHDENKLQRVRRNLALVS